MATTLGLDLYHENNVIEQYDSVREFLPLPFALWIPAHEISEKGSFQESLPPFFLVRAGLATDFGHFAHPKPQLSKFVEIEHSCPAPDLVSDGGPK